MIDRGIGVAGLALSIIFGALQYVLPQLPAWVMTLGIGSGVFLLGLSVGLVAATRRRSGATEPAEKATLRLHVYSDHRTPDRVAAENIFRWYYLRNSVVGLGPNGETTNVAMLITLFVTFEPEVKISSLKVRSSDIRLPPHEVKEFNQKFAIIAFLGEIPEGTLEIAVEP